MVRFFCFTQNEFCYVMNLKSLSEYNQHINTIGKHQVVSDSLERIILTPPSIVLQST